MTDHDSMARWSRFDDLVAERTGLHFLPERRSDLERGLHSALPELGCADIDECLDWILSTPLTRRHIEILANHLTIGETYFFRDKTLFHALRNQVLPDLIEKRIKNGRNIRIWCAGCCTGEEPYSIAMLLRDMIPKSAEWRITLLATDINRRFLRTAVDAAYSQWSFRDAPTDIREKFFLRIGDGRFQLKPDIRQMVEFSMLNLVEDVYPSVTNNTNAMDIIICRNVLMYFTAEQAFGVINRFYKSLAENGYLVVSPTELSHTQFSMFSAVNVHGAILYTKRTNPTKELPPNPGVQPHFMPQPRPLIGEFFSGIVSVTVTEAPAYSRTHDQSPPETEEPPRPFDEAVRLYESGRYGEAIESLLPAIARREGDADAMALLSRSYANLGRLKEALLWCERAVAADKLSAAHYYLMAAILQEQGEADRAEIALNKSLYIEPRFVLASFALGNLYRSRGKYEAARRHFENALENMASCGPEDVLTGSEGMTSGRLAEIIHVFMKE